MASNILSVSTTAATSNDVTVSSATTFGLKGNSGPTVLTPNNIALAASVDIQLKDDAGQYWYMDTLHTKNKPALIIYGPGTYRFVRSANSQPVGVFSG